MDMTTDSYIYVITALLPVVAVMLIVQVNPYHALVIRGILGAVAALLYTVLGAADVALTEALVGTLLAMMLYAVAVRLGVLQSEQVPSGADRDPAPTEPTAFAGVLRELREIFGKRHMRVDVVPFGDRETLQHALAAQDIHATCTPMGDPALPTDPAQPTYHTITRLPRLYQIMQAELTNPTNQLSYIDAAELAAKLNSDSDTDSDADRPNPSPPATTPPTETQA